MAALLLAVGSLLSIRDAGGAEAGSHKQVLSAGSLRLNLGMNRETTITGIGFSTYVEHGIRLSAAARSILYNVL